MLAMQGRTPFPRLSVAPPEVPGCRWLPLTKGKFALIDEEDYTRIAQFSWCYGPKNMASRATSKGGRRGFLLHREVMRAPEGIEVDHINMDQLDCRKSNLRLATAQQNRCNREKQANNTSGFKGVTRGQPTAVGEIWLARIQVCGKSIHLGSFVDPAEAARAYDKAALHHFGEFARLNFK